MPYILEGFGTTPIPHYNGTHDLSTAEAMVAATPLPGGVFDLYGSERAPARDKVLQARGWLVGDGYEDVFRALRARARERDVLWRLWDDGEREWTWARLISVPASRGAIRGIDTTLSFHLPLPLWYAETPGSVVGRDLFDEDGDDLATTGAEGDAVDGTSAFLLVNRGNLPATKVVFTITSGTGTITAVTLTNVTTGHVLVWAGSLTTGQQLIIDAGAGSIKRAGVDAYSQLTEPPDKERWMELAPGENIVNLAWTDSAVNDSSTIVFSFEHTSA